jgi:lysophospholipase L1-like esterase
MLRRLILLAFFVSILAPAARAADSFLKEGDFVAICGDSITEQKQYSVFIEDYLLMCRPKANLRAAQFGWSGETAPGFLKRMDNEVLRFKPTVATTCYGMNDGGYAPMTPATAQRYRDAQTAILERFKKANVRVVLGSPGCVDADSFKKDPKAAEIYNKTLGELREIDRELAKEHGVAFADVYGAMMDAMTKAKAKYGSSYDVAGGDGVHPNRNGHLVMAYAFLKAMGCDGDLGKITLNLSGESEAVGGHRIVSSSKGSFEIESTRYPFCFDGDPALPASTRGIIEFVPFNEDLNRLTLVVNGVGEGNVMVTWGEKSKEFPASTLVKGINLAAEFSQNPFSKPFADVEKEIRAQQNFETPLVKEKLHAITTTQPADRAAMEEPVKELLSKEARLVEAAAGAVTPVRHTIKIAAMK